MPNKIILLGGTANPELTEDIYNYLREKSVKVEKIPLEITKFSDGEQMPRIPKTVRGHRVYLIQPTCPPVDNNLMELLLTIDALRRASVKDIAAIIPYFGYARQDRKSQGRVPISARLVANLIEKAGADRVAVIDIHAGQTQGFFNIPCDNLQAKNIFAKKIRKEFKKSEIVIVAPDSGGLERVRELAQTLNAQLAHIDKRRDPKTNKVEIFNLMGEVKDRIAIILDDIISTGTTLVEAVKMLMEKGALEVYAAATHGLFSKNAYEIIDSSQIKRVIVTDSIPPKEKESPKIERVSSAPLLAESIFRTNENKSVSRLFNNK